MWRIERPSIAWLWSHQTGKRRDWAFKDNQAILLSKITPKLLLSDSLVLLIRNLSSSNLFFILKRLVKQNIPKIVSRLLVYSFKNQKCLNPFCWNQTQDNLILLKEDHQTLFNKNEKMITNFNFTGLLGIGTILVSGIILNSHQDFHTKDTHLKPIMRWGIIFQISGDSVFINLKILIIMFSLFIISIKRKIKSKILFSQTRVKNQIVIFCL